MRINIRPATRDDRPEIRSILLSTFEHTWQPQLTNNVQEKTKQFHTRMESYLDEYIDAIYVACVGIDILGLIHWFGDFVAALHVTKDAQGKGVGSALLNFAAQEIGIEHRRIRLETDTFNTRSRAFYKKHGFDEVKQYPDEEWDSDLTTILLEKPL